MNWEEIKKTCPKAFNILMDSYHAKQMDALNLAGKTMYYIIDRALYDFFDEQKIIIIINYEPPNSYNFNIYFNENVGKADYYKFRRYLYYSQRTEAETEAFTKAFEILEKRLK